MKIIDSIEEYLPRNFQELIDLGHNLWKKHPVPVRLFLLMCFNLLLIPGVQAATGGQISTGQAYWLAFLGLVTLALAVYLFVVIVQPERF